MIQRRCFLPNSITDKSIIEEKYPDPPQLTDAEDPNMVSDAVHNTHGCLVGGKLT